MKFSYSKAFTLIELLVVVVLISTLAGWPERSQVIVDHSASYHSNTAAFSFADGHAEIHKWLDKRTYPKINKGNMPNRVDPMVNNPNFYWMIEKSARLIDADS